MYLGNNADRVQKLKEARAEAAKEIEDYRSQKDNEFERFEVEVRVLLLRSIEFQTQKILRLTEISTLSFSPIGSSSCTLYPYHLTPPFDPLPAQVSEQGLASDH